MHRKKHFKHVKSKSGQGHLRSSSTNFQKNEFWSSMHRKGISDIMGGQNQVSVTKGHQVQMFKMYIFELHAQKKLFDITVGGQNQVRVT